jgi:uncharacterized membrane protein
MQVKTCAACRNGSARYVCQKCSRGICEVCFDLQTWLCADCHKSLKPPAQALKRLTWPLPLKLFLFGLSLMLTGTLLVVITAIFSGEPFAAGTVIFVGPIPIIWGTWPYSLWTVILAIVLTILGIVMFIIGRKRTP